MTSAATLYDLAGGMPFFVALVDRFYDGVAADVQLRQIYPEPDDLTGARHRLTLFLAQYWGGPTTYDTERGHPRLRMRHAPFAIGRPSATGGSRTWPRPWRTSGHPPDVAARLVAYFDLAAEAMRNRD